MLLLLFELQPIYPLSSLPSPRKEDVFQLYVFWQSFQRSKQCLGPYIPKQGMTLSWLICKYWGKTESGSIHLFPTSQVQRVEVEKNEKGETGESELLSGLQVSQPGKLNETLCQNMFLKLGI